MAERICGSAIFGASRGGFARSTLKAKGEVSAIRTRVNSAARNWYVISGIKSGKIFYQKTVLSDEQFKTFYFEYDEGKKKLYDPIAAHISRSFKSFKGL